jgi:hypothetical protein
MLPRHISTLPISAGRDWPLYDDEYGGMEFSNAPKEVIDHHYPKKV